MINPPIYTSMNYKTIVYMYTDTDYYILYMMYINSVHYILMVCEFSYGVYIYIKYVYTVVHHTCSLNTYKKIT